MGWNTLDIRRRCALLEGVAEGDYAYFVHSYAVDLSAATVASTCYGHASAPACNGEIFMEPNSIQNVPPPSARCCWTTSWA